MGIRFRVSKKLPAEHAAFVRQIVDGIREQFDVPHKLYVFATELGSLECPDGMRAFGVFVPPRCAIYVAAGVLDWMIREEKFPKRYARAEMARIIAHEFAHYEQWRDGRELQERGVNVRAASILRKIGAA